MRICLATALAVLFAAAGCETRTESPVGLISPGFDVNAGETVPFSATFSGEAKFDPPAAPTRALFEGSGEATHLGTTINEGVLAPLDFVPVPECPLGVGIPHTHLETLTAANGDQLFLEMDDLACPIDQTFMRFRGTGDWTVVDGSGRFADASGFGTVVGVGDFIEGTFEFSLTGELTY
jgi:hypothetical protein